MSRNIQEPFEKTLHVYVSKESLDAFDNSWPWEFALLRALDTIRRESQDALANLTAIKITAVDDRSATSDPGPGLPSLGDGRSLADDPQKP